MQKNKLFDVIIVGGSYAGLSAAMALGRSLRNVLIIDGGRPCNRQTPHSHNFLTQDGKTPLEIATVAKEQVAQYKTVEFTTDVAIDGERTGNGFKISTQSGRTAEAKKLIFSTGVKDLMPNIKGFSECWGISVIHCPYCHGYEFRGKKTGIMANGEHAFHLASLVNNLTSDLTILTNGKADFSPEQTRTLTKHGIRVIETQITEILHQNGHIEDIAFENRELTSFDAVYASIPFEQQTNIPTLLGCTLNEDGYLEVDGFQETTAKGIYACGDNTTQFRSVAHAIFKGNAAGAVVNKALVEELF